MKYLEHKVLVCANSECYEPFIFSGNNATLPEHRRPNGAICPCSGAQGIVITVTKDALEKGKIGR